MRDHRFVIVPEVLSVAEDEKSDAGRPFGDRLLGERLDARRLDDRSLKAVRVAVGGVIEETDEHAAAGFDRNIRHAAVFARPQRGEFPVRAEAGGRIVSAGIDAAAEQLLASFDPVDVDERQVDAGFADQTAVKFEMLAASSVSPRGMSSPLQPAEPSSFSSWNRMIGPPEVIRCFPAMARNFR